MTIGHSPKGKENSGIVYRHELKHLESTAFVVSWYCVHVKLVVAKITYAASSMQLQFVSIVARQRALQSVALLPLYWKTMRVTSAYCIAKYLPPCSG